MRSGLSVATCLNSNIENCSFKDINTESIGYGIQVMNSSQHITVQNNFFENCRHGFTTSGYDGVCMYLSVQNNHANNCTNSAFNSHGNARFVKFYNNMIVNSQMGISVYSPFSIIESNTIVNSIKSAIYAIESGSVNLSINDNIINKSSDEYFSSISVLNTSENSESNYYIKINNNIINDAKNGAGISVDDKWARTAIVRHNCISNVGYHGAVVKNIFFAVLSENTLDGQFRKNLMPWKTEGVDILEFKNNSEI